MKAEELRLGNWVNPKFPMQVTCIYKDEILCDFEGNEGDMWEFDPKDLDGIPLSQEWLVRFGFENDFIELQSPEITLNIASKVNGIWLYLDDSLSKMVFPLNLIKYVHQLQNLYFALTGKEL